MYYPQEYYFFLLVSLNHFHQKTSHLNQSPHLKNSRLYYLDKGPSLCTLIYQIVLISTSNHLSVLILN